MRQVPYINKSTSAGTQYRKTTTRDKNIVLEQCRRLRDVANDCEKHGIKEGAALSHPNPKMPKMSTGQRNSAKTMCEGVIDNFGSGQYDLSDKQCAGLEEAFRIGHEIIEDFEEITFEEVASLPKLPSVVKPTEPTKPITESTFGDLFGDDYEIDTITLRRKK